MLQRHVAPQRLGKLDFDPAGVHRPLEDRVYFLGGVLEAGTGDDFLRHPTQPITLLKERYRVSLLQQPDRAGQPRRPTAEDRHGCGRNLLRQPHADEPLAPGDPAEDQLDVADGDAVPGEHPLQAPPFTLDLHRAYPRTHLGQHVAAAEHVVGLLDLAVGKRLDESRHVHPRRTVGRAGGQLAVAAPPSERL